MKTSLSLLAALCLSIGSAQAMSEGEYLAKAADCMACHTSNSDKPYAGGVKFDTPVGAIYSTNITPSKAYGLGEYSEQDFANAVRKGVAKDGHHLYPAMPYKSYQAFSDKQISALYQYFRQEVPAVEEKNRENDIPWLLSARWPMAIWNWFNDRQAAWQPQADKSAEWNRGAWLVEGPGHCGSCHTPRDWKMQEKGLTPQTATFLSGAKIEGWYAPSLRNLPYDAEQVAQILKTGHNKTSAINGPMSDVISQSTQYLTDGDLKAIGTYLTSFSAAEHQALPVATEKLQDPKGNYARYCSTCHGTEGRGTESVIPALTNNLIVTASDPASLIKVISEGANTPLTEGSMSWSMPGYQETLSAEDIAELATYVRGSFGNHADKVTQQQVEEASH